MITVTTNGQPYGVDENSITYISPNGSGGDIYTENATYENLISAEESPADILDLSPMLSSVTNTQDSKVIITIAYTGSDIGNNLTIAAGKYQKLTDNGSTLTAVAVEPNIITVGDIVKSEDGFGTVGSVSYSFPTNPIYLNLKRIKYANKSYYGGSQIGYNDSGADLAQYYISSSVSTVENIINSSTLVWQSSAPLYINTDSYTFSTLPYKVVMVIYSGAIMNVYEAGVNGGWAYSNGVVSFLDINGDPFNLDDTTQLQIIYA